MRFSIGKKYLGLVSLCLCAAFLFSSFQDALASSLSPAVAKESFVVVLDAGHGGVDSGTIGVNGAREKDLNLAVTMLLASYLEDAGVTVLLTRREDNLVLTDADRNAPSFKARDLANRLAVAENAACDLLVSLHMNSFPVERYAGFEAYYSENHASSLLYAKAIAQTVRERCDPTHNRPIKKGKNMYLLENATVPAVLLECGFLSNYEEAERLSDKDYQKELSFSIFCAIMDVKENLLR